MLPHKNVFKTGDSNYKQLLDQELSSEAFFAETNSIGKSVEIKQTASLSYHNDNQLTTRTIMDLNGTLQQTIVNDGYLNSVDNNLAGIDNDQRIVNGRNGSIVAEYTNNTSIIQNGEENMKTVCQGTDDHCVDDPALTTTDSLINYQEQQRLLEGKNGNNKISNILRDCSDEPPSPTAACTSFNGTCSTFSNSAEFQSADSSRQKIPLAVVDIRNSNRNRGSSSYDNDLINIGDNLNLAKPLQSAQNNQTTTAVGQRQQQQHNSLNPLLVTPQHHQNHLIKIHNPGDSKRVRFKGISAASTVALVAAEASQSCELVTTKHSITRSLDSSPDQAICDSALDENSSSGRQHQKFDEDDDEICLSDIEGDKKDELSDTNEEEQLEARHRHRLILRQSGRKHFTSYYRSPQRTSLIGRTLNRFRQFGGSLGLTGSSSNINAAKQTISSSNYPYVQQEDKDLLTGASKYQNASKYHNRQSSGRTFRGSYRYSRIRISMTILKKLTGFLFQRSTAAVLGAFLIHVTLGTIYTLSNINSYLTSYMRKHGSPNATYGGSMWISSAYAVGQGFSMVLGGYIEKRFSARLACSIGCALHSLSVMATSWSVDHGSLAVLTTYGLIPGFGCGLAYMTPMSNGFAWFPNRKGLVAGVILAGFGIGTFVFNMAQTAYVNPENLSPPDNALGYFVQASILDRVPHLFIFVGSIYAAMQFVGCCLLFKPPLSYGSDKLLDERPILLENEMSLKKAIRTREFIVLFLVYGITTQGVLFVNSMLKEYGQLFIGNDMYLAWTGSMASIANSAGRLIWGLGIDRYSFTVCFTSITIIFGSLMFIMPFEFVLSSKLWYLLCTLGIFGSFSGWMSTYPVHLSRVFGRANSGMIYGLIFISQSCGGILTALGAHYLIDHFNRFVPFFCVVLLELLGLLIYHLFYPK